MLRHISIRFLQTALPICFLSCSKMYTPTIPNVATFNKKYEVHGEGALTYSGFNYNTSFSATKHICVQFNGLSIANGAWYREFAFGIFNILTKELPNQITVGYGLGEFHYRNTLNGSDFSLNTADGNYSRKYLQVFSAFGKNEKRTIGLTLRISEVRLKITDIQSEFKDGLGRKYTLTYFEPYVSYFRNVSPNVSFSFHAGGCLNASGYSDSFVLNPNLILSAGLVLKFNTKERKAQD